MEKYRNISCFLFSLLLFFGLAGSQSYADSVGYIDVQVTAPDGFERSIMINLISEEGTNCLITADYFNDWKVNLPMETGRYQVDFISIEGDLKNEYEAEYKEHVEIVAGHGTIFPIEIAEKQKSKSEKEEVKTLDQTKAREDNRSTSAMGLDRLKTMIKGSIPSLSLVVIILIVFFIVKRRQGDE